MALTTILPSGLNSANDFSSLVPAAYSTANAAFLQANAAFLQANNSTDTWVRTQANSAYDTANSGSSFANGAFLTANASYTAQNTTASFANGAFLTANSGASFANASFLTANSGAIFANSAFDRANAAYAQANTGGGGGGGITYTASNTAPTSPHVGDQWYIIATNVLYEYINDGTSNNWVDIVSPTISNNVVLLDTTSPFLLMGA
jgi:hypothetical protein